MLELSSLAFLFGGGTDVGEALRGMICFQIHIQAISSVEQRTPCFANKLDGSLPAELGNCSSLVELRLQNNLLGGNLPPEICNVENLEVLFLSNNAQDWEMGRLSSLKLLALYSNNLTDLHRIDQTANRLYGLILPCVCNGTNPRVLMLGEFRFHGSFPIGICLFLRRVIRGDNLLSGSLPLERNSGISYLEVRGNLLEGNIPAVFGLWSNLSMIELCLLDNDARYCNDVREGHTRGLDLHVLTEDLLFEDIMPARQGWSEKYVIGRSKRGTVFTGHNLQTPESAGLSRRHEPCVVLDWDTRYRFTLVIAQGLSYLHHDRVPQIIQRYFKSDNNFLDSESEPEVGDFRM
ncbi:hypothetical protein D5086_027747 [Populus alba]|uniref:Uncharacterized protein n=1 Tax=Populus alba TaxID=43335 RepID=A0ACC4AXI4_POPAL